MKTQPRTHAIRCDHDGLKMAEVKADHLILRARHHGELHIQIIPLRALLAADRPQDPPDNPQP